MSIGLPSSFVILLLLSSQVGCENLGLDPSGKLACSRPPQDLCPKGFFCSAGRCWRNGTIDALVDSPADDAQTEAEDVDSARVDGSVTTDEAAASDVVSEASGAAMTTGDAEDGASPDGKPDVSTTCGVCPSPPSNGKATCSGTSCAIACDFGYRNCSGTLLCIRNGACCADIDCPKNTPACVSGQCKARANNDPCSSDTECGSGHCDVTASGSNAKVCCDSDCAGTCNDGCPGGTCQHKKLRTACGEIDNSPYTPRYFVCDGNGNCNPPSFFCNGFGNVCAATKDVVCCGDPNNGYVLGCVTPATCASQNAGDFEMSCGAAIDCPSGTFCCSEESPDVLVTGCAANCQTFSIRGDDPTTFIHNQLCDLTRDPSCPAGKQCKIDQNTGLGVCSL